MPNRYRRALVPVINTLFPLFFAILAFSGPQAIGQTSPGQEGPRSGGAESRNGSDSGVTTRPGGARLSPATTALVAKLIREGGRFCQRVNDRQYRVDCLAEQLEQVVRKMPAQGDYAEARSAIADGARKLTALAAANRAPDRSPATLKSRANANQRSRRPVVPVDQRRIDAVDAAASDILSEVETVLLRSAGTSEARKVAYQEIARAVDSNKILLRSA